MVYDNYENGLARVPHYLATNTPNNCTYLRRIRRDFEDAVKCHCMMFWLKGLTGSGISWVSPERAWIRSGRKPNSEAGAATMGNELVTHPRVRTKFTPRPGAAR